MDIPIISRLFKKDGITEDHPNKIGVHTFCGKTAPQMTIEQRIAVYRAITGEITKDQAKELFIPNK